MRILLTTLFSFLLSLSGTEDLLINNSPRIKVNGMVYSVSEDNHTNVPVAGATVELLSDKDTLYTTSNESGRFSFSFEECFEIKLKVSCLGYKPYMDTYQLDQPSTVIAVAMIPDKEALDAAVVKGEIPFMTRDGDTTIFNAAAIETMKNDPAIKLLGSIPGFEYRDGTLYFEGEPVKKTYVNGKLIFGDNNLSALALLDADEIKSVNVYDQQSALDKHRGKKNSKKERVLNLKTFKEFTSASDLMAQARGGLDGKYSAGFHHSYNSEMLQTWTEVNSNNICDNSNDQGILRSDKVMDADLSHHGAEIAFVKNWKDAEWGNSLGGGYSFEYDKNKNSYLKMIDRAGESNNHYKESVSSCMTAKEHSMDLSGDFNDTPLKKITIGTELSFSDDKTSSIEDIAERSSIFGVVNQNQTRRESSRDYHFNPLLIWSNPDRDDGWMPSVSFKMDIGHSNAGSFTLDTLSSSYNQRYLQGNSSGLDKQIEGSVYFNKTKNIKDKITIDKEFVLCEISHVNTSLDRLTVNRINSQDSIDLANSCKYTWNDTKLSSAFKYTASMSGLYLFFMTGISYLNQKDDETFPSKESENRSYIMPAFSTLSLDCSTKRGKLSTSYTITSDVPSIEQTRQSITNSNPLRLQIGNPDLDNTTLSTFALNYSSKSSSKGNTFSLRFKLDKQKNAIVDKVQYFSNSGLIDAWGVRYPVPAGATLTSYENADGMRNLSFESKYNMRLKALKGKLSAGLSFNSFRTPQYDGEILNNITSNKPQFSLSLNTVPAAKVLRLSLSSRISYLNEKNNSGTILAEAVIGKIGASSEVRFLKDAFWDTKYSCSLIRYRSGTGIDTDFHNLSSAIGYMFMDGKMGISISGSNLLNKASNYSSSSTSSEFTQTWKQTYGRYFLLNISYRVKERK